jgi:hypothetical protein
MKPLRMGVVGKGQINNHTEKRYDERCSWEAIVKWCEELAIDREDYYGIGIRYQCDEFTKTDCYSDARYPVNIG